MQKLRDRLKGLHKEGREITSLRKAAASIEPDRILQRVAEKYQVDRERLVARGGREPARQECSHVDDLGDGK